VAAGAAVWEAALHLACGMGFYHIRVSAAGRHRETLAFMKIDGAQFKVSVTKPERDCLRLTPGQSSLIGTGRSPS
jgi:hypothetical protein